MSGGQPEPLKASVFDRVNVSISASEGGPPTPTLGATPENGAASTPSTTPRGGVTPVKGEMRSIETQTLSFCVNSFSSHTCLELLIDDKLSLKQIQHEANYLSSLSHGRIARMRDTLPRFVYKNIVNDVRASLAKSVCIDYQAAVQDHELTLNNFSCLV